ncbi:Uncharacterised protein [Mycobacteroides abscessus subsp. abscessus]|nr:Uncharacterised protein [Mycobacteroides abscessus subsp. abscessus]
MSFCARSRSTSLSELHSIDGVEEPTPRGSNPMKSKRSRISLGTCLTMAVAASMPDCPGPPGFISSDPILLPLAGYLMIANRALAPSGLV